MIARHIVKDTATDNGMPSMGAALIGTTTIGARAMIAGLSARVTCAAIGNSPVTAFTVAATIPSTIMARSLHAGSDMRTVRRTAGMTDTAVTASVRRMMTTTGTRTVGIAAASEAGIITSRLIAKLTSKATSRDTTAAGA